MTQRVRIFLRRNASSDFNPSGGSGMELIKKIFLLSVGVITIAFDEASKAVEETLHTVNEQREKINGVYTKQKA
jgi:hypothetical protein